MWHTFHQGCPSTIQAMVGRYTSRFTFAITPTCATSSKTLSSNRATNPTEELATYDTLVHSDLSSTSSLGAVAVNHVPGTWSSPRSFWTRCVRSIRDVGGFQAGGGGGCEQPGDGGQRPRWVGSEGRGSKLTACMTSGESDWQSMMQSALHFEVTYPC